MGILKKASSFYWWKQKHAKKYEELLGKIIDIIKLITKIRFNSDDYLPLKNMLELHEENKYCPQVFLSKVGEEKWECLYNFI